MTRKKPTKPLASIADRSRIIVVIISLLVFFFLLLLGYKLMRPCTWTRLLPLSLAEGEEIKAGYTLVNSPPYYVGDRIRIRLEVTSKTGITYQLPDLPLPEGNALELLKKEKPGKKRLLGGEKKYIDFTLVGWEVGASSLLATQIEYTKKKAGQDGTTQVLTIPSLKLEISSVLPEKKSKEELLALPIKPTKEPVGLPGDYPLLRKILPVLIVLLLLYIILQIYRRKKRFTTDDSIELPLAKEAAHLIALHRLDQIKAADLLGKHRFELYYSELTECLREYFEDRFSIKAMEMTTEEFLLALNLSRNCRLVERHKKTIEHLLSSSDLVKFAKYRPDISEAEAAWDLVRMIIIETKEEDEEDLANQALIIEDRTDRGSNEHDLW